jgi:hypothetical protein
MNTREELEQIKALVALEEERGPIVPDGAQGGLAAKARREAARRDAAKAEKPVVKPSAAQRARDRVRAQFQANDHKAA